MKKQYITPTWRLHHVTTSDIIITSDPQLSDDPSDGGGQLASKYLHFSNYHHY